MVDQCPDGEDRVLSVGLRAELTRESVCLDPTVLDQGYGVTQFLGLAHVVRREEDAAVVGPQAFDELAELVGGDHVHAARRLVE